MNFTQIKETCLYVKDLDRTERFYGQVLELPMFSKVQGRHVFFRAGTSVLLCFNPDATKHEHQLPPHYAEGKQHIAFEVLKDEYDPAKQKLRSKGVKIIHRQSWKDDLESFYFEDPDGHVLEVVPKGIWE